MTRALLIGKEPAAELGYDYVTEAALRRGGHRLADSVPAASVPGGAGAVCVGGGKAGLSLHTGSAGSAEKPDARREVWPPPSGS